MLSLVCELQKAKQTIKTKKKQIHRRREQSGSNQREGGGRWVNGQIGERD